ncbi:class I SAM-dependent DNA methyltransferase [Catenuloplanes atrovinosus]|uniref:SAM-dependent methyltransferase n=1 Tax=Catenuloplanes atrovinosus TaxID=137266 RepID=A0AAE3YJS6_9ACTN|nr:class I SAM-dependent methyltransferase [Catenuloplanes atrovinosus]MDR7275138.1 SAM-dependent methyltransferase [Catenuloplanes atrovinosus]
MPDAIFDHPRLAALYDAFDGDRGDLDHYLAIADELGARRVIDVGCGTGRLAARLADSGRAVLGADPALASLEIARARDGRVRWVHAGAADVPPWDADLATMTGNVAQVFVTDAAWAAALRGVRGALRPGGWLVFETRRPERRDWENWPSGPETRDGVERTLRLTGVSPRLVSFRHTYRFPDGTALTSDSTLRFRTLEEIEGSLTAAGFTLRDVRDAPDRPGLEWVIVAQAAQLPTPTLPISAVG